MRIIHSTADTILLIGNHAGDAFALPALPVMAALTHALEFHNACAFDAEQNPDTDVVGTVGEITAQTFCTTLRVFGLSPACDDTTLMEALKHEGLVQKVNFVAVTGGQGYALYMVDESAPAMICEALAQASLQTAM